MARVNKVETCIICDCTPCTCNSKPVRKAAVAREAPARREAAPREPRLAPPRHAISEEDLVLAAAIRTLAPILHTDELTRYSSILSSTQTVSERAAAWRARRTG